ncbi:hypothetical protein MKW92_026620, partial [Papaver armeniacum]
EYFPATFYKPQRAYTDSRLANFRAATTVMDVQFSHREMLGRLVSLVVKRLKASHGFLLAVWFLSCNGSLSSTQTNSLTHILEFDSYP